MRRLHIDIETYSSVDIKKSGAYKYTQSLDFEILLCAYAFGDDPIQIIDLAQGETLPKEFTEALLDPEVIKCAHNATFERISFKQYGFNIPIDQWFCTAVKSAYCGLPLALEMVSSVLKLEEKGKLSTGKALIRYFCNPCKPTKANGMRMRNFPWHDPEKWEDFKRYCVNDVEAEREIDHRLAHYELPPFEQLNYLIDQEINDTGVLVDVKFVENAVAIDDKFGEETIARVKEITGLDNPNSPAQLKGWLSDALGKNVETLAKDSVVELLSESEDGDVSDVLDGRLKLAKSSTKKYIAMLNCAAEGDRAHGLFQFYGANRTGRWAGRLIQLQNLPQNHMRDLDHAREVIASGDYGLATMLYDSIPSILSELIRTALIAPEEYVFAVSDFSAIEARVLSWVAQEEWRLEVFRTHGKIYEASAAMMFGVPIDSVTKGSDLRQKGKTAELALGYQGAEGAMDKMDRDGKIPIPERTSIVKRWRKANPKIVQLWADVEQSAIRCIETRKTVQLGCLTFEYDGDYFLLGLPSGRKLFYKSPRMGVNRFGNKSIIFKGMDQVAKQWTDVETYGGKLVENIVQAISRDLFADSMQRLRAEGFKLVMHVHDEVICEVHESEAGEKLKQMEDIMGQEIPWAKGLPLVADGYTTKFYKKD